MRASRLEAACSAGSLALLALYVAALAAAATAAGVGFHAVEPWPLGGRPGTAGGLARGVSLLVAGVLGWGLPGLSLALLGNRALRGTALLGRALGLGTGYVVATGLVHAALAGHAPGRASIVAWLAVPPLVLAWRARSPAPPETPSRDRTLGAAIAAMVVLGAVLWPKLTREAMNGDGTEAYELARSLESHRLPHWDLERWEGPGRFGIPAVNPFVTNSYLGVAGMTLAGHGELAVRLPFVTSLVLAAMGAAGLAASGGRSGAVYLAGVSALYALWNAYYVGYEPAFTDLAEPAATDTLMTALWLAGFREVAAGAPALGVSFLLLASGILYSGPVLATTALAFLAWGGAPAGRRALGLWAGAAAAGLLAAVLVGAASGDLGDWVRQLRSEYWQDFVDRRRGTPGAPLLAQLLWLTGGLVVPVVLRARRLSPAARALGASAGLYLGLVLLSEQKNLHYLAPLPFLLAPPALEVAGASARLAGAALAAAGLILSWPAPRGIHREGIELGERSCVDGLDLEHAALEADAVYHAFARPGDPRRFGVGKHTFVRYAWELGAREVPCEFRLGAGNAGDWIPVAGDGAVLSVRDPDRLAFWRFRQPPVPSSWLFPRVAPPSLPRDLSRWTGRRALSAGTGRALLLDGFEEPAAADLTRGDSVPLHGPRARILVPARSGAQVALGTEAPAPGLVAGLRVNGIDAGTVRAPGGRGEVAVRSTAPPWRAGWNVLELEPEASGLALRWLEARP